MKNIDIGAAYINILQNQQLAGINDPQTLRYATIVSYANGAGAMLRTFHQINVWQSIKLIVLAQTNFISIYKEAPGCTGSTLLVEGGYRLPGDVRVMLKR